MDTGMGEMAPINEKIAEEIAKMQAATGSKIPSVFTVGEVLPIKGSLFRIQTIGRKKMQLKILKQK